MDKAESGSSFRVYIGTYTKEGSEGIYAARFDASGGLLSLTGHTASVKNPSLLCADRAGRFLYSVSEVADTAGKPSGAVTALAIDAETGELTQLNSVMSQGQGPCHVAIDATGRTVLVANYRSGTIAALPVQADGSLGDASCSIQHSGSSAHPRRQAGPHAHSFTVAPGNRFAYAADLGIDKLVGYRLDAGAATLTALPEATAAVTPGSGPRHVAFHPRTPHVYLVNELSNTVTVFAWDSESGALKEIQTVGTLPEDFEGENTTADIHCSGDGRFVYASNRGHDSVAVFRVAPDDGTLTLAGTAFCGGKTPRNFALDPTGMWLLCANQDSDNVVVFRIDQATGMPMPTGREIRVSMPVCVRFIGPAGPAK